MNIPLASHVLPWILACTAFDTITPEIGLGTGGMSSPERFSYQTTSMPSAVISGLPLLIYLAISLFFFGHSGSWTREYFGQGPDPILFTWFIHWWPFAVAHGLNPFTSDYIWFPHGLNLAWSTSVPSAALLGFPATLLGGPVLSFNLLSEIAPALSAWTAFLLARFLTRDWFAAAVGGYLFGFSSYEIAQMLGHLNLDLTFLVPLAVLLCLKRATGELGRGRFVAAMTAVLLIELGFSSEILATLCVLGAITWAIFFINGSTIDRRVMPHLAIDIALASVATALLSSPFFFFLVKGLPDVSPQVDIATMYSADPLNYVIPTIVTRIGRTVFSPLAKLFTGNASEQGAYLGLPLLLLMALYFRGNIARPYTRAFLITTLAFSLLSLGPWLHIGGLQTKIALPWAAALRLPLIRSALPVRLTLYVSLCSAMATSLYLAAPGIGRWRLGRFALAGLACLFLVPNTRVYAWTPWPAQQFFTPQIVRQALGAMPNVVILPFNFRAPNLAWQLDARMEFRQSGGYVGLPPYTEWRWPIQAQFAAGVVGPNFSNDLAAYCATHRVAYVLVGPGTQAALATAIMQQGWPQHVDHGVRVVQVPPTSELRYSSIEGDYWPELGPANWMGHRVKVVTHRAAAELIVSGTGPEISGTVDVTADRGSSETTYRINPSDTKTISIPPNAAVTLTASRTFVPDRIIHNGDQRNLSVLISLKPLS